MLHVARSLPAVASMQRTNACSQRMIGSSKRPLALSVWLYAYSVWSQRMVMYDANADPV